MKKILLANLIVAFLVLACKPESIKPIGQRSDYMSKLPGTYKLTRVTQSDVKAVKNNYPYKTLDLTNKFPYSEFELTLNGNGSTPSTFSTKQGNAPAIIRLTSGNWKVDNTEAPKMIFFINGTDSVKIQIGSYNGFNTNQLNLRQVRNLDGKPVINYDYEFTKK
jgi:uncharacterized protein DUF5004